MSVDLEACPDLATALRKLRLDTRPGVRWRKWHGEPYSVREVERMAGIGRNRVLALEQAAHAIRLDELLRLAWCYGLDDDGVASLIRLHPEYGVDARQALTAHHADNDG